MNTLYVFATCRGDRLAQDYGGHKLGAHNQVKKIILWQFFELGPLASIKATARYLKAKMGGKQAPKS